MMAHHQTLHAHMDTFHHQSSPFSVSVTAPSSSHQTLAPSSLHHFSHSHTQSTDDANHDVNDKQSASIAPYDHDDDADDDDEFSSSRSTSSLLATARLQHANELVHGVVRNSVRVGLGSGLETGSKSIIVAHAPDFPPSTYADISLMHQQMDEDDGSSVTIRRSRPRPERDRYGMKDARVATTVGSAFSLIRVPPSRRAANDDGQTAAANDADAASATASVPPSAIPVPPVSSDANVSQRVSTSSSVLHRESATDRVQRGQALDTMVDVISLIAGIKRWRNRAVGSVTTELDQLRQQAQVFMQHTSPLLFGDMIGATLTLSANPMKSMSAARAQRMRIQTADEEGAVKLSSPSSPMYVQGDISHYSTIRYLQRIGNSFHLELLEKVQLYFDTCTRVAGAWVSKWPFIHLLLLIHKQIMPDTEAEEAVKIVLQDWKQDAAQHGIVISQSTVAQNVPVPTQSSSNKKDAKNPAASPSSGASASVSSSDEGQIGLNLAGFHAALFQLVDTWTVTCQPSEYVRFLSNIYPRITQPNPEFNPNTAMGGDRNVGDRRRIVFKPLTVDYQKALESALSSDKEEKQRAMATMGTNFARGTASTKGVNQTSSSAAAASPTSIMAQSFSLSRDFKSPRTSLSVAAKTVSAFLALRNIATQPNQRPPSPPGAASSDTPSAIPPFVFNTYPRKAVDPGTGSSRAGRQRGLTRGRTPSPDSSTQKDGSESGHAPPSAEDGRPRSRSSSLSTRTSKSRRPSLKGDDKGSHATSSLMDKMNELLAHAAAPVDETSKTTEKSKEGEQNPSADTNGEAAPEAGSVEKEVSSGRSRAALPSLNTTASSRAARIATPDHLAELLALTSGNSAMSPRRAMLAAAAPELTTLPRGFQRRRRRYMPYVDSPSSSETSTPSRSPTASPSHRATATLGEKGATEGDEERRRTLVAEARRVILPDGTVDYSALEPRVAARIRPRLGRQASIFHSASDEEHIINAIVDALDEDEGLQGSKRSSIRAQMERNQQLINQRARLAQLNEAARLNWLKKYGHGNEQAEPTPQQLAQERAAIEAREESLMLTAFTRKQQPSHPIEQSTPTKYHGTEEWNKGQIEVEEKKKKRQRRIDRHGFDIDLDIASDEGSVERSDDDDGQDDSGEGAGDDGEGDARSDTRPSTTSTSPTLSRDNIEALPSSPDDELDTMQDPASNDAIAPKTDDAAQQDDAAATTMQQPSNPAVDKKVKKHPQSTVEKKKRAPRPTTKDAITVSTDGASTGSTSIDTGLLAESVSVSKKSSLSPVEEAESIGSSTAPSPVGESFPSDLPKQDVSEALQKNAEFASVMRQLGSDPLINAALSRASEVAERVETALEEAGLDDVPKGAEVLLMQPLVEAAVVAEASTRAASDADHIAKETAALRPHSEATGMVSTSTSAPTEAIRQPRTVESEPGSHSHPHHSTAQRMMPAVHPDRISVLTRSSIVGKESMQNGDDHASSYASQAEESDVSEDEPIDGWDDMRESPEPHSMTDNSVSTKPVQSAKAMRGVVPLPRRRGPSIERSKTFAQASAAASRSGPHMPMTRTDYVRPFIARHERESKSMERRPIEWQPAVRVAEGEEKQGMEATPMEDMHDTTEQSSGSAVELARGVRGPNHVTSIDGNTLAAEGLTEFTAHPLRRANAAITLPSHAVLADAITATRSALTALSSRVTSRAHMRASLPLDISRRIVQALAHMQSLAAFNLPAPILRPPSAIVGRRWGSASSDASAEPTTSVSSRYPFPPMRPPPAPTRRSRSRHVRTVHASVSTLRPTIVSLHEAQDSPGLDSAPSTAATQRVSSRSRAHSPHRPHHLLSRLLQSSPHSNRWEQYNDAVGAIIQANLAVARAAAVEPEPGMTNASRSRSPTRSRSRSPSIISRSRSVSRSRDTPPVRHPCSPTQLALLPDAGLQESQQHQPVTLPKETMEEKQQPGALLDYEAAGDDLHIHGASIAPNTSPCSRVRADSTHPTLQEKHLNVPTSDMKQQPQPSPPVPHLSLPNRNIPLQFNNATMKDVMESHAGWQHASTFASDIEWRPSVSSQVATARARLQSGAPVVPLKRTYRRNVMGEHEFDFSIPRRQAMDDVFSPAAYSQILRAVAHRQKLDGARMHEDGMVNAQGMGSRSAPFNKQSTVIVDGLRDEEKQEYHPPLPPRSISSSPQRVSLMMSNDAPHDTKSTSYDGSPSSTLSAHFLYSHPSSRYISPYLLPHTSDHSTCPWARWPKAVHDVNHITEVPSRPAGTHSRSASLSAADTMYDDSQRGQILSHRMPPTGMRDDGTKPSSGRTSKLPPLSHGNVKADNAGKSKDILRAAVSARTPQMAVLHSHQSRGAATSRAKGASPHYHSFAKLGERPHIHPAGRNALIYSYPRQNVLLQHPSPSHTPVQPASRSSAFAPASFVKKSSSVGGWIRDLTQEGVEPNPGPAFANSAIVS